MTFAIIAAMSRNRVIGNGPEIPWEVKGEQKLFREITTGGTLIMGRKTQDTIGRPLPGRTTIIVTRQPDYEAEGCLVVGSVEQAIKQAEEQGKPIFVAGGGELYSQTIDRADELHLSVIETEVAGDVYFPAFNPADYELIEAVDYESNINYRYHHYRKKAA